jgi:hypothetical protein
MAVTLYTVSPPDGFGGFLVQDPTVLDVMSWTGRFVDSSGADRTSVEVIGYFWDTSGWDISDTFTTQALTTDSTGNATFVEPSGLVNNPCLAQFVIGDGAGNPTGPSSPLARVTFQ